MFVMRRWAFRLSIGMLAAGGALIATAWATSASWGPGMIVVANSPGFATIDAPGDAPHTLDIQRAGVRLRAWVFEPDGPARGTVVLLHGIRDNKTSLVRRARTHAARGFQTVAVDLRGHGESSGRYLTYGVEDAKDIRALVDEMRRLDLLRPPLAVVGTSYGAGTALQYAALDPRVKAVVAIAPFASLREIVPDYIRWMFGDLSALVPPGFVQGIVDNSGDVAGFDPDEACPRCAAQTVTAPVLLVHSRDDERIPFGHSMAIKQALPDTAQLMLRDGPGHNATGGAPGVQPAVHAWLAKHLAAR